jgi:subfamily B ATP-binding cassette protein MsbA
MERREILRRLRTEARPYLPQIALALALGVIAGLLPLVPPLALAEILNKVLAPAGHVAKNASTILIVAIVAIWLALVLSNVTTYFQTYLTAWCGQHLIKRLRVRLFERVLNLPIGGFDKWRPGELITRFSNDLQLMTDAVSISFPQLVVAVVTFVSSLAAVIWLDWFLTLILLVVAPIVSFAVSRFQNLITTSTRKTQGRIADLTASLTEVLQGQRVVKAFGREDFEVQRFRNRNEDLFGAYLKLTQFINTQPLVVSPILVTALAIIIWLSIREVLVGRLNIGNVFGYWVLLVNLINPMNRLAAFVGEISKALVGAGRVFEILDLPVEDRNRADARVMPNIEGKIAFDHVVLRYSPEEPPALNDVNATVAAGEIVALVGPSGAGKTTIVNLVPGFYTPESGRVLIDDVDIADLRLADLRAQIAIVPQDPQLFRASIAENIRYGRLEASDDDVRAAAREANADQFVSEFPEGYATEVGERGVRLSGGERQRIAIARAILRDPRILILDEATSALDSHSEVLIEQALDRLLPGRTTLIIAHRLSTIRRANRIFYVEGGRILETGTNEELLARGGAYAALHARQFAGT